MSWICAWQLSGNLWFNGQQKLPVASLNWNPCSNFIWFVRMVNAMARNIPDIGCFCITWTYCCINFLKETIHQNFVALNNFPSIEFRKDKSTDTSLKLSFISLSGNAWFSVKSAAYILLRISPIYIFFLALTDGKMMYWAISIFPVLSLTDILLQWNLFSIPFSAIRPSMHHPSLVLSAYG